jgi:hypothetical protein
MNCRLFPFGQPTKGWKQFAKEELILTKLCFCLYHSASYYVRLTNTLPFLASQGYCGVSVQCVEGIYGNEQHHV